MTQQYSRNMGLGWECWGRGQMYTPTWVIFQGFFFQCLFVLYLSPLCFFFPCACHHFISFVVLVLLSWLCPTCCSICHWSSCLGLNFPQASTLILGWSFPIRILPLWTPTMMVLEGKVRMNICAVFKHSLLDTRTYKQQPQSGTS